MMKRQNLRGRPLAALLLLCLLSVLVVACGSQGSNDDAKQKEKQAKKEKANTPPPMASNGRYFANNSPWNTQIAGLPQDTNSARMIDLASTRVAVIEKPGQD